MQLYYRVISIDETDFSITVRYFSEELSEFDLRSDREDPSNPPLRCLTDYNLNIWQDGLSEEELHKSIIQNAPRDWLRRKGQVKKGTIGPMTAALSLVGQEFTVKLTDKGEIDITHELQA